MGLTSADLRRLGLAEVPGSGRLVRVGPRPPARGSRPAGSPRVIGGPDENRLESLYRGELEAAQAAGAIDGWAFQPLKVRLAPYTYYAPDFAVWIGGRMTLHEIKGHLEDDASVKFKGATQALPLVPMVMVRRVRGQWRALMVTRGFPEVPWLPRQLAGRGRGRTA